MKSVIYNKYNLLLDYLKSLKSVVLAYSGGVDSTFLLKATKDSQIDSLAVIGKSPTMPSEDLKTALEIVNVLETKYELIDTDELRDQNFTGNLPDRCFYCKDGLFKKIKEIALNHGYSNIIDGSNADDTDDYRPGLKARELYNVLSPLMETGFHKDEIRFLSKEFGLFTWDKPSSPCLSSRFPYGERITIDGLKMVEEAENVLKRMDFKVVRVRKHGNTARIELKEEDIIKLLDQKLRKKVLSSLRDIGFLYVTLDLEGYQSGKMNRTIDE